MIELGSSRGVGCGVEAHRHTAERCISSAYMALVINLLLLLRALLHLTLKHLPLSLDYYNIESVIFELLNRNYLLD